MRMNFFRRLLLSLCAGLSITLSGCMAIPLAASGIAVANSANILAGDRSVAVSITEAEKAKLSALLKGSKRVALLDSGPATATTAETMEKGGLIAPVAVQYGDSTKMSPSQQRESMQKACASERSDAVLSGRTGDARTNRLTYLIGKAETEVDIDLHVLDCRSRTAATVRVVFKFDAAIQGSEQESFRRAGMSLGKAVVEVAGGVP